MTASPRTSRATGRESLPMGALTNALWLSGVATGVVAAWILVDRDGWSYYTTPLGVRGYHPVHRVLRPSGRVAHWLGVAGGLMMSFPLVYMIRKRVAWLSRAGSLNAWLEVHIFCGLVGPVLVTFHTSLKFNGLVSVAYWSMVIVALSGIIGRYLYVRIPRTLRGVELTHDQVATRADQLKAQLEKAGLPESIRQELDVFERPQAGALTAWRTPERVRRALVRHGVAPATAREVARLGAERSALVRRMASLTRTKKLFGLWHVFHLPLVWLMFAIVALHVGLALYLGYWPAL